ncbi:inositol 2-dehydrogenase [Leucothrix sargassi]|nr:inositol 2-dehydrogenase [Leucothrix sargassi]
MKEVLNVGLIGAGRIGKIHAENIGLHPELKLHSVSDFYATAAEEVAKKHAAQVSDTDSMFNNDEIDMLIIASPTDTHADFLERACTHQKPVLCEKPIDNDAERAKQCVEQLEQFNNTCGLAFNRRHDPLFQQLKADVVDGKLGKLEMIVISSRDPSPPPIDYIKTSGGLFKDMMVHDFDVARWLLDEPIVEVYATGSNLVDSAIGDAGDIDTAMVVLKTASGRLCHINNSRRAVYGYDQRIEAFGSEGMLIADNVRNSQLISVTKTGSEQQPLLDFFLERYEQAYKNELHDFLESVKHKRPPLAGPRDGLMALRIAEAAEQSLVSGNSVAVNC